MTNSWWRNRHAHYMVIGRLLSHSLAYRSNFGTDDDVTHATFLDAVWFRREKAQDERNAERLAQWKKKAAAKYVA